MLFNIILISYCALSPSVTHSSNTSKPYYISPNRFDFNNAKIFCRVRCDSELSSIHNERDYRQSLVVIENSVAVFAQNEDVWSGLNDIETEGVYRYVDKTSADYVPWKTGSPNNANPWNGYGGQDCIEYSHAFNYLLDDTECNNLNRLLCNKCDSMIHKYVIVNEALYYDEASAFCSDQIGTNLASIHSFDDHNEALFLCQLYDYQCWIGLILSNALFEWTDSTQFDYGNDVGLGVYPWDTLQPNATRIQHTLSASGVQYGTALSGDSWSVFPKSDEKRYFLCNLPSELCNQDAWNIVNNKEDSRYWTWTQCELEINSLGITNDMSILAEKQWINTNGELIIEYMLKITEIYTENGGYSAVLLFNFESVCNYYEVGILYMDKLNIYNVYVGKWMNGVHRLLQTKPISDEFGTYYVLRVIVIDKYKLAVSVNGKQYLDVTDIDRMRMNRVNNASISGYIGLINNGIKITAKSLYVSGSAMNASEIKIDECEAMIQLQHMLNEEIEYKVEYGVITSIIIHIKNKQWNAFNVTNSQFANILSNITNDILNESIKIIDKDCVFENKISIQPIEARNILRINITIFVCKKQTQSILTVEFTENLERDFIEKVNDESDENEVLLSVDTEEVEVQVANTERIILITPSPTASDAQVVMTNFMELLMKHTMWIIVTVVAICSFAIILLIICRKCYQWNRKKESKKDEIGGAGNQYNDHSIPIMEIKTESMSMDLSMEDEHTPFKWKQSEMLIVRYPGDDHYIGPVLRGPGFSVSEKRERESMLRGNQMADDEFIVESDSDRKLTAK